MHSGKISLNSDIYMENNFMNIWIPCPFERPIAITAFYTAFKRQCGQDFSFEGEIHNFWEVVCVINGTVGVAADSDVYKVPAGRMIIHRPMEFHRIWAEGGTSPEILIFSFDAKIEVDTSNRIFEISPYEIEVLEDICNGIKRNFETKMIRVVSPKPGREKEIQISVNTFENLLLTTLPHRQVASVTKDTSHNAEKYARIVDCLIKNADKNLTTDDIARLCGMSPSGVKQSFKKYAGCGVIKYFRDLKIKTAISMLNKNYSVKETALSLGFTDPNYFSTVFKRVTGQSPTEYTAYNKK